MEILESIEIVGELRSSLLTPGHHFKFHPSRLYMIIMSAVHGRTVEFGLPRQMYINDNIRNKITDDIMLRKFSVTNYKNFAGTVCIDFTDARKYDFNTECIKDGLINKALILGRNGVGKSNLGLALFDISYTLTDNLANPLQVDPNSFLNGDSKKHFATFTYEFQQGKDIIYYEYRKRSPDMIIYETMSVNGNKLFTRDGNRVSDYSGLKSLGIDTLQVKISDGPLAVLRYIHNNSVSKKGSPIAFVVDFVSRMLYFRSVQDGNQFIGLNNRPELIEQYIMANGLVEDFQRYLKETGNIDVNLDRLHISGMQDTLVQKFKNRTLVFNNISSSGTKALTLFYYWMKSFNRVSFLYMDEFDAYYHYDLAEKVIREVISHDSFQAVATTHNTDLVDNGIMRPDCYLILTENGLKSLPERTIRELREGHNLRKLLRGGEFDD